MKIEAKIIAHSVSALTGKQIVTWELQYPRFIHGEFMTHRLFSRNAASSRAIPVAKMIEMVREHPAKPVHWGQNQPGMQAKVELDDWQRGCVIAYWEEAAYQAANYAESMAEHGAHKQIANRILEPFQWMKTVMTATELDNWFWLRDHEDADPTIQALAHMMWEALQESVVVTLEPGEWHVPYFREHGLDGVWLPGSKSSLQDALAISASCCAQVSYRKLDDSLDKAKDIFAKLIESEPCHASPTEHQATPMKPYQESKDGFSANINDYAQPYGWEEGITHADRNRALWSGNFKGWIQHRQLIPNNVCKQYTPRGAKE